MEDLTLIVQKRAFPSTGRARVNVAVLKELGVEERGEIDVGIPNDRWITVAAFSDTTIEVGTIRLSDGDLSTLDIEEGTGVIVRKTVSLSDQVHQTARVVAGHAAEGMEDIRGRIAQTLEPVAVRAKTVAQEAYTRVSTELASREEFTHVIDEAKQKIAPSFTPDDAGMFLTLLYENKCAIRAVVLPPGRETTIAALGLPEGVRVIAFRRGESRLVVPPGDCMIRSGDQVFLIGSEDQLTPALQKISS